MVTTKYFGRVDKLKLDQRPADALPPFDIERLRAGGIGAHIVTRLLENPRWWLAILRRVWPVPRIGGMALVTRNADVREVLERQDVFQTPFGPEMTDMAGGSNFILGMQDGAPYRRLKSVILTAFPIDEIDTVVRPIAAQHARDIMLSARPGFNAARDLLKIVPVRICRDYFGVLIADEQEFADWSIALSALFFSDFGGSAATRDLAVQAADRMRVALDLSIEEILAGRDRRDTPLARLVAANRADPGAVSRGDIIAVMMGMISGFVPTDLLAAGNALDVILSKREAQDTIEEAISAGDDRLLDKAILEAMRFKPIFLGPARYVARDAVIGEASGRRVKLKEGTTLIASTLSAMFDPDAVASPGRYDPARPSRDYMVFGHGIHWCIGSAIARADIRECFRALFLKDNVRRKPGKLGRLKRLGAYPEELRVEFDMPADCRLAENSLVTVIAPIAADVDRDRVRALVTAMGNPATEALRDALDAGAAIHFASLAVVDRERPAAGEAVVRNGHLVLELSGDGEQQAVIAAFAARADRFARPVFEFACGLSADASLPDFLSRHAVAVGPGFGKAAGLGFCGTPGHSVRRIRAEAELEADISDIIRTRADKPGNATDALKDVREKLAQTGLHDWAFQPADSNLEKVGGSWNAAISAILVRPLPVMGIVALVLFWTWVNFSLVFKAPVDGLVSNALLIAASFGLTILGIVLVIGALAALLIWLIRRKEKRDIPSAATVDLARYSAICERENRGVQNNLTAISTMKPGPLRLLALRIALFAIEIAARFVFRPGHLSDIGTIHYARWVLVPGTGQLLFFSNYGGSWESYLEDFITKATKGLTGVWSNTEGFPKTKRLFFGGAEDGDRFKRWARLQQSPTLFWYSAYPKIDTTRIRINSRIRQGLSSARSESEARAWLDLFGSLPRPANVLETDEIQSIFFGPMGALTSGETIAIAIPQGVSKANRYAWLHHVRSRITFGDRLPDRRALVAAFGPSGLERLGLDGDPDFRPLSSFPLAFQQGMADPSRSRILDDTGVNNPATWRWGAGDEAVDAVIACYGVDDDARDELVAGLILATVAAGMRVVARIPMVILRDGDKPAREHFGFADGLSQPIITGTPRSRSRSEPQHVVAAGEFLLGYRDQRGYVPPSPQVEAAYDPRGWLSRFDDATAVDSGEGLSRFRDFGRNGSFLVLRQLEQHVERFDDYCREAAHALRGQVPGEAVDPEWVGAKMVGRWKDGTSLVRNPHHKGDRPPDNAFTYGDEDPQGTRCPLGSHIRRSNPRDSLAEDRERQIELGKRHRILRVGRTYEYTADSPLRGEKGLLFMCLNADIERQFEFIQQTWVASGLFHGLRFEKDPLIGSQRDGGRFTIPSVAGGVVLKDVPNFVTTRGGGYFFMPGRRAVEFMLSRLQ